MTMTHTFKISRLVEFSDTDMAGIVHFTAFFRYMEQAEHAFYRSLNMSVIMHDGEKQISFPRVHASCDYTKPLRFEDEIEIELIVREKKTKVLAYEFIFRKLRSRSGFAARAHELAEEQAEEVARGKLIVVCVTKDHASGTMKSIEIPASIADRIGQAP
jgi:acyl-CoA thioester hydrolase